MVLLSGTLFVFIHIIERSKLPDGLGAPIFASLVIAFIYVLSVRIHGLNFTTLYNLALFGLTILFFFGSCCIQFSIRSLVVFTLAAFPAAVLGIYMLQLDSEARASGLGGMSAPLTFFPLLLLGQTRQNATRLLCIFIVLFGLAVIWMVGSRAVWIGVLGGLFTFVFWKTIITKNRFIYNAFFLSVIAFCFIFVFLYAGRYSGAFDSRYVDELAMKYTEGRFYSGREMIWANSFELIKLKPITGYGLAGVPQLVIGENLSAHNFFIQVALQTGVFTPIAFVLLLTSIWNQLWNARHSRVIRLAACYLVMLVIFQTFEVSLTQNNLAVAVVYWLILGIALGQTNRELLQKRADLQSMRRAEFEVNKQIQKRRMYKHPQNV